MDIPCESSTKKNAEMRYYINTEGNQEWEMRVLSFQNQYDLQATTRTDIRIPTWLVANAIRPHSLQKAPLPLHNTSWNFPRRKYCRNPVFGMVLYSTGFSAAQHKRYYLIYHDANTHRVNRAVQGRFFLRSYVRTCSAFFQLIRSMSNEN